MNEHLIEINRSHLFTEYLQSSGLKRPQNHNGHWEIKDQHHQRVLARMTKEATGKLCFFICGALLGKK